MFTNGESTNEVIKHLSAEGVKLNVTAVFTVHQVIATTANLNPSIPSIISIFAGRIADAGVDPIEVFGAIKPAATMVAGLHFLNPEMLVEIEVDSYKA
jgi:transaldolase